MNQVTWADRGRQIQDYQLMLGFRQWVSFRRWFERNGGRFPAVGMRRLF